MTNSSVLNPDEKRLVSYFASRVIMSFGEAQELRSAIARRYAFEDQRLIHFAQELLRRSGLSDSSQPPSDHTGQDFSKVQQDFLGRSVAYLSPGFDLGPRQLPNKEAHREQSQVHSKHSAELNSLTYCYSCTSAEGKPKKIYRSRLSAEQAAHVAGRVFSKTYSSYVCLVQSNWWHLRTVKPVATIGDPPSSPATPSIALPPPPSPDLPKVQLWTPDANAGPFQLDLRAVATRGSIEPNADLNQRIQEFLVAKLQAQTLRTTYRWIHIEALDSIVDAKTAIIYSPEYVHVRPDRVELHFAGAELHIPNRCISWR